MSRSPFPAFPSPIVTGSDGSRPEAAPSCISLLCMEHCLRHMPFTSDSLLFVVCIAAHDPALTPVAPSGPPLSKGTPQHRVLVLDHAKSDYDLNGYTMTPKNMDSSSSSLTRVPLLPPERLQSETPGSFPNVYDYRRVPHVPLLPSTPHQTRPPRKASLKV